MLTRTVMVQLQSFKSVPLTILYSANFLTYSHHGKALWLVVSADQHSTYPPLEH